MTFWAGRLNSGVTGDGQEGGMPRRFAGPKSPWSCKIHQLKVDRCMHVLGTPIKHTRMEGDFQPDMIGQPQLLFNSRIIEQFLLWIFLTRHPQCLCAPATKSGFHLPDGPMVQGPKFRVGELAGEPVELKNGEVFEFGVLDLWASILHEEGT